MRLSGTKYINRICSLPQTCS